jgi:hypothetical protein
MVNFYFKSFIEYNYQKARSLDDSLQNFKIVEESLFYFKKNTKKIVKSKKIVENLSELGDEDFFIEKKVEVTELKVITKEEESHAFE